MVTIQKASNLMTATDKARMIALKEEYSALTTSPARMREVYAEMVALRTKVNPA